MAYTSREIAADRARVFAVLTDPHTYPAWLVGNVEVQEVDDGFPEPGTGFRHQVGAWPFTIADRSLVMDVDQDRLLRLDVRARPFVRAVATFPNGAGSPAFVLDGSRLKADPEGAVILELTAGRHTLHAEVDDHRSDPVTFEVE